MSASVSSRELFEVRTTIGCVRLSITAQLGDRDLEVGEDLEQHRLELLVGLVDLVDQEHDRLGVRDRAQERAGEDEVLGEDLGLDARRTPRGRCRPVLGRALRLDVEELLAVVPLVKRLGLVEALVALEADQLAAGRARDRLRELGLADPRRALDEDRLSELLGEVGDERRGLVREVADRLQGGLRLGD